MRDFKRCGSDSEIRGEVWVGRAAAAMGVGGEWVKLRRLREI